MLLPCKSLADNIVVFPGKRPAHFLRKYLADKKGRAVPSPGVFSMDSFVEFAFAELGQTAQPASQLDLAAVLYDKLKEATAAVISRNPEQLDMDSFLPWAFKLISDFEELKIELKTEKELSAYDLLLPEEVRSNAAFLKKFSGLSKLYGAFYSCLETENLLTRSARYVLAAENIDRLSLDKYENIIFAGFFGLTGAEKLLLKKLSEYSNVCFLLQDGPGISEQFSFLSSALPSTPGLWPHPKQGLRLSEGVSPLPSQLPALHFYKSSDTHGQIFKLGQILKDTRARLTDEQAHEHTNTKVLDSTLYPLPSTLISEVIVLPTAESLFPLVQNVLPAVGNYNVSMGYPITATPVYALIDALADLMDKRTDGKYFLPDYLKFVFHPYVKNIYSDRSQKPDVRSQSYPGKSKTEHSSLVTGHLPHSAEPTRIIFQSAEEILSKRVNKHIELSEIENDREILQEAALRSGIAEEDVRAHLVDIHSRLIKPFEKVRDVGDFAGKLLKFISRISENSTASLHAYWSPFARVMMDNINELAASRMQNGKFEGFGSYFKLFKNFISGITYPFPGTPLKGLQVLGFLETRNLKFERVYFLDANADILPRSRKEDTILPHHIREKLGLSTSKMRERTAAYYFELLTAGAKEVHVFYRDNAEKERSPFVEKLIWQTERAGDKPKENDIYFRINFSQKEPKPVAKDSKIIELLKSFEYSPSGIDTYLACGLKFYYRYVLRISEKDEVSDEIEQRDIGTIVHEILQAFFLKRLDRPLEIAAADFKEMGKTALDAFDSHFRHHGSGFEYLIKRQIEKRLAEVLEYHRDGLRGVKIKACEVELKSSIKTKCGEIKLRGRADRIDERMGCISIIDYKTGCRADVPSWQRFELENRDNWLSRLKSVQLPVYIYSYLQNNKGADIYGVNASLMLLGGREIEEKPLFYPIRGKDPERKEVFAKYIKAVTMLLEEIQDPGKSFDPATDEKECAHCAFKTICARQWVRK
ncbi:MAG: PD-(D/E)XK nuclease family protein [bacterium]